MNIPSIYRVNKNNQLMVSRMSEPSTVYNYILLVWGDPQPKPSLATGVGWVGDFVVGGSSIATPAKKKKVGSFPDLLELKRKNMLKPPNRKTVTKKESAHLWTSLFLVGCHCRHWEKESSMVKSGKRCGNHAFANI